MDVLQSFYQYATTPVRKSKPKVEEVIYREELFNKKLQAPMKVKKKVQFESKINDSSKKNYSKLENENEHYVGFGYGEKSVSQVKILMTKEEAARLLSKCKQGGVLEFKDVANELVRIPNVRVNTVSTNMKVE